jgi:polysaccharide biosynthesis transport protein
MRIDSVRAATKDWEAKVVEANARIAEAERLKLNVNRTQSLYDRLVSLLQNVDISRNIDQETLAILEPASPAKRSYRQDLMLLALSIFGGLGTGLGIVALIALRDDRFTSVVEVNEKLGDGTVGQVPEMPLVGGRAPLLLEEGEERHIYAESYRSLRSALLFLAVEGQRPKIVLITSALPGEGKSTVAANLARTMAMGGARVLLVDGDLRKGVLHELMGLNREPGLSDLLQRSGPDSALRTPHSALDDVIQTNSLPNLAFISSGKRLSNPGDLFLGTALEQLFIRWREQYDYVLIDSSPVFAADDATTLAPKVDGTLFVVRNRFSGARQVREALELLYQRQARVLGLVFNRVDATEKSYHYYKYAQYYPAGKDHGTTGEKDHGPRGPGTTDHKTMNS